MVDASNKTAIADGTDLSDAPMVNRYVAGMSATMSVMNDVKGLVSFCLACSYPLCDRNHGNRGIR